MSTSSKEHYSQYFYELTYNSVYEGSSLQEMHSILKVYEELQDYEACEGINKALEEIKVMTLSNFIDKINYIHGRLSH